MAKVFNAKDIAIDLDTDTRTLRKFFRSTDSPIDPVGKGGRYAIAGSDMRKVRAAFKKWDDARKIAETPDSDTDSDI